MNTVLLYSARLFTYQHIRNNSISAEVIIVEFYTAESAKVCCYNIILYITEQSSYEDLPASIFPTSKLDENCGVETRC